MSHVQRLDHKDQRIQDALAELQSLIQAHYPTASFEVSYGDDPEGVYLVATIDAESTLEVMNVVIDPLLALQIDEGLPVYVIPIHSPDWVAATIAGLKGPDGRFRFRGYALLADDEMDSDEASW